MPQEPAIEQIERMAPYIESLADLLVLVVQEGASVGYLPPLDRSEAIAYWSQLPSEEAIVFVAVLQDAIVGTVQLHLCAMPNGRHRAEIAKLMTSPAYRRRGIGRLLMQEAESRARAEGRTLLVLDTREGDGSNRLYSSMGYELAGKIPKYAQSANGELDATLVYYKHLDTAVVDSVDAVVRGR